MTKANKNNIAPWKARRWKVQDLITRKQQIEKNYFPPNVLNELINYIPGKKGKEKRIKQEIISLGSEIDNRIHLSMRPTPAQCRKALRKVGELAHKLRDEIVKLDDDSMRYFRKAMFADQSFYELIADGSELSGSPFWGDEKYIMFVDLITKVETWCKDAEIHTNEDIDGKVKNKQASMKHLIADAIVAFWIRIGQKPSWTRNPYTHILTGPLIEFANEIAGIYKILPISSAMKQSVDNYKAKVGIWSEKKSSVQLPPWVPAGSKPKS